MLLFNLSEEKQLIQFGVGMFKLNTHTCIMTGKIAYIKKKRKKNVLDFGIMTQKWSLNAGKVVIESKRN